MLILALAFAENIPGSRHLVYGGLAGVAGAAGLSALYHGLATGTMGVVAPLSAVLTAVVPMLYGWVIEGMPEFFKIAGFVLALMAVWFLSSPAGSVKIRLNALLLPTGAGLGFGLFFVLISHAGETAVLWPLVSARAVSITLLGTILALTGKCRIPEKGPFIFIALTGILDAAGNALFVMASQFGRLDMAAVLSSLYPISTVILAWWVLGERLRAKQWIGIGTALAALALITS